MKKGHDGRRKGLAFFYLNFLCILQEYSVSGISRLLDLATARVYIMISVGIIGAEALWEPRYTVLLSVCGTKRQYARAIIVPVFVSRTR
jgi:hypothetical protein